MPYARNADLPKAVREGLPKAAQTIYRSAYNNAWDEYKEPTTRHAGGSREETAHRVAWAAVKHTYEKRGRRWVKKRT